MFYHSLYGTFGDDLLWMTRHDLRNWMFNHFIHPCLAEMSICTPWFSSLFHSPLAQPWWQAFACRQGCARRLSVAFEKWLKFPSVTWAYNVLQVTLYSVQVMSPLFCINHKVGNTSHTSLTDLQPQGWDCGAVYWSSDAIPSQQVAACYRWPWHDLPANQRWPGTLRHPGEWWGCRSLTLWVLWNHLHASQNDPLWMVLRMLFVNYCNYLPLI